MLEKNRQEDTFPWKKELIVLSDEFERHITENDLKHMTAQPFKTAGDSDAVLSPGRLEPILA